jgi:hypothetical protein
MKKGLEGKPEDRQPPTPATAIQPHGAVAVFQSGDLLASENHPPEKQTPNF